MEDMEDEENGHQILEAEHSEDIDDDMNFDERMQTDEQDDQRSQNEIILSSDKGIVLPG